MLAESDPPITSSPISPFLDEHAFRSKLRVLNGLMTEMATCFNGTKARRVLGFEPAVSKLEPTELKCIVEELQADGLC